MVLTCSKCKANFSRQFNLHRHLRELHDDKSKQFKCGICGMLVKRQEHLKSHMRAIHLRTEKIQCSLCEYESGFKSAIIRHLKLIHKNELNKPCAPPKQFGCSLCPKKFRQKKRLSFHLRKKHSSPVAITERMLKKKCPLCSFAALHKNSNTLVKIMHDHFKVMHHLHMQTETLNFNNISDFDCWKSKLEKETATKYIRLDRSVRNLVTFVCHRSGNFYSKGNGLRKLKLIGSCKINGYCPASIKIHVKEDSQVAVNFIQTHVGHKNEVKYISPFPSERKAIAEKRANKLTYETILGETKGELTDPHLNTIDMSARKDLSDNENSFNLEDDAEKRPFDAQTVEAWALEFYSSDECAAMFYKPQGTLNTDFFELQIHDFVLFFMTDAQRELFKKYNGDIVCVDCVTSCEFKLFTFLVLDKTREGVPVAFMFSNRDDEAIMAVFFEKIRQTVGAITARVFMYNTDATSYNAWSRVMGETELQLLSPWYALKAWMKNIDSHIQIKQNKDNVYETLQILMCELDTEAFFKQLSVTMNKWSSNEDTKNFSDHFFTNYVAKGKYRKWAFCYGFEAGLNSNMALENYNKLLEYCYLNDKRVERLDKTLCAILKLLQDKLSDIITKTLENTIVSKLKILRKRHNESATLIGKKIFFLQPNGVWHVSSTSQDVLFKVKKIQRTICLQCPLQCQECRSCFHQYVCSCLDHGINNNMCEHIHMVAKLVREHAVVLGSEEDRVITFDVSNKWETAPQNSLLEALNLQRNDDDTFENARETFAKKLYSLVKDNIHNFDELKEIQHHCKSILPILNSMKAMSNRNNGNITDVKTL